MRRRDTRIRFEPGSGVNSGYWVGPIGIGEGPFDTRADAKYWRAHRWRARAGRTRKRNPIGSVIETIGAVAAIGLVGYAQWSNRQAEIAAVGSGATGPATPSSALEARNLALATQAQKDNAAITSRIGGGTGFVAGSALAWQSKGVVRGLGVALALAGVGTLIWPLWPSQLVGAFAWQK